MDPLTIDDLLLLLGRKEAHIAQLQRHIAVLEAQRPTAETVPVVLEESALNGLR